MTTWFAADHHFNHKNILEYCNRPFKDVDEMNYKMIDRHNEVVKPYDDVWFVGDFTLEGQETFSKFISQLNGHILIVPGGHDKRWMDDNLYYVTDPLVSLEFDIGEKHPLVIVLCHYALRMWDRRHYGALHLYGHSHGNLPAWPGSMDVGVDCHNFYPVSLEQVLEKLR